MFAAIAWQTVWRSYVRDVAVPCAFARPWWQARLRAAVPLGSAEHAGVNAAHEDLRGLGGKCVCVVPCHWGARNMLA